MDALEKKSLLTSLLNLVPGRRPLEPDDGNRDCEAIEIWLTAKVAKALEVPVEHIDVREPFANFGLDSRTAVSLSGELERWLGRRLSPTLIWDYPSIEAVAQFLGEGVEQPPPVDTTAAPINELAIRGGWSDD